MPTRPASRNNLIALAGEATWPTSAFASIVNISTGGPRIMSLLGWTVSIAPGSGGDPALRSVMRVRVHRGASHTSTGSVTMSSGALDPEGVDPVSGVLHVNAASGSLGPTISQHLVNTDGRPFEMAYANNRAPVSFVLADGGSPTQSLGFYIEHASGGSGTGPWKVAVAAVVAVTGPAF